MIKKVTMYTVLCDRCGKDACENCVMWNEDESELIPKPEPVEPKEQK